MEPRINQTQIWPFLRLHVLGVKFHSSADGIPVKLIAEYILFCRDGWLCAAMQNSLTT